MAILKDLLVIGKSKFNTPIDKDSLNMSSIIDTIYPVGSIYMSINSSSPAILFGGTWVQIEDQFLLGCSSSYSAGSTGGSATVTLTESNMPAHAHDIDLVTESNGSHTHTTSGSAASAGSHTHTISGTAASTGSHTHNVSGTAASAGSHVHSYNGWYTYAAGNAGGSIANTRLSDGARTAPFNSAGAHTHSVSGTAASNGAHTHSVSGTAASNGAHTHTTSGTAASAGSHTHSISGETSSKGSSTAHNNMPPYLAVYIWKRTA